MVAWRRLLAQPSRDRLRDRLERKSFPGVDPDNVRREDIRNRDVVRNRPCDDGDDRHAGAPRGLQGSLVVLDRRAAEHVDEHRPAPGIVVGAHRARLGIATELSPQHRRELSRPADDERLTRFRGGGDFLDERAQHAEADRQSHQRRRDEREARPRAWIASSTPIAARVAINDGPPTLTNGSGMQVIGAMPIVMPTFTKIWNSNATTMPPATIAE